MGPEGGNAGGQIIATGSPKTIAAVAGSYTGQYLKKMLASYTKNQLKIGKTS